MLKCFPAFMALASACIGPAAAQDYVSFQSPTGNIHCAIFSGRYAGVRCDIGEYTPSFPLRPVDCDFDWGFAFVVDANGTAGPICASDTVRDLRAPILDYGRSFSRWGIVCRSEQSGMTCTNARGHGFTLSRRQQRVF